MVLAGRGRARAAARAARAVRAAAAALAALALGMAATVLAPAPADAEPLVLRLDAATTQITFTLDATLHTVEGALRLEGGEIAFHAGGGPASGRVVVDARSADTGIERRDRVMHEEVLESERYPTIVFEPRRLEIVRRQGPDRGEVSLSGILEIHGSRQELTIPATVKREGRNVFVEAAFDVPYVEWGMNDPSTFVLRVGKTVRVRLDAAARTLTGTQTSSAQQGGR